ncbi:MAG: hypothetical protein IKE60_34545 [Reyranella sp.]|uniref:hypothetical protein n=1 Tax=Reyranella sp. TaxID=1929291 RepID=UPI0025FDDB03|nr:hypothetical protein [Reyranella sp.]MBR2819841.1 hypothetical protein [Reyranella sp.]
MSDQVPMRAIDKITAHFASTKGLRKDIDTSWGFKIWVSPWTLGEKDRVFGNEDRYRPRSNARLLIVKAEDENGRRLFSDHDEAELLNEADSLEVQRVAMEILRLLNADNAATIEGDASPKH